MNTMFMDTIFINKIIIILIKLIKDIESWGQGVIQRAGNSDATVPLYTEYSTTIY